MKTRLNTAAEPALGCSSTLPASVMFADVGETLGLRGERVRWPAAVAVAAVGLTACLGLAPPADAISRDRAEQIALRALKPPKKGAGERVTVSIFGLPAPLGARAVVTEGGPSRKAKSSEVRRVRTARLGARTWLFWRDSKYGAKFSHPSVLLLVDDRTGKVRSRKRLSWWPLVNGRQPAFLRNEKNYLSPRFRIYSDLDLVRGRSTASAAPAAEASLGRATASRVPPGVFARDCLLTLSYRGDPRFAADVRGMEEVATAAGIRTFRVRNRKVWLPPDASDLRRATREVVAQGCRDVLLYITAHGTKAGSVLTGERTTVQVTQNLGVLVGMEDVLISHAQISQAIADQAANATFKVKVDTCYAGRQLPLINLPNVLIVETSSQANEISYFSLPEVLRRGRDGELFMIRNTRNGRRRGEFTNRNVVGLQRFFERPDEVQHGLQQSQLQRTSFLAWSMSRAFALGENADFAWTLGWTDPQLRTRFQTSAPN